MYEWETEAASDLESLFAGLECPEELDMTLIAAKMESMNHGSHVEAFVEILENFCTSRHQESPSLSYGCPPTYDPLLEHLVWDLVCIDEKEVWLNTTVEDPLGQARERSYRLARGVEGWQIACVI